MKKVTRGLLRRAGALSCALAIALGSYTAMPVSAANEQIVKPSKEEPVITVAKPVIKELVNEYSGVRIRWNAAEGAKGYYIFRRSKSSEDWVQIKKTGNRLSYMDKNAVKEGGIYNYMIRAYNGDVVSEDSDSVTISRFLISRAKVPVKYGQDAARKLFKFINYFRIGKDAWIWNSTDSEKVYQTGLGRLVYDYDLEKAAMTRAVELSLKLEHERPNGRNFDSVLGDMGYKYKYAGEIYAYGYSKESAVFNAFLEEKKNYRNQSHRRVMLSDKYNVCAVGHVVVNNTHYWAVLFAYTTDDSDYTKINNSKAKASVDIVSEDLDLYKNKLKKVNATVRDYKPGQIKKLYAVSGSKTITLQYSQPVATSGYEIYRSINNKKKFKKIATVNQQNVLSYTDKKVTKKKKYYYYVVPFRVTHGKMIYGKKSKVTTAKTR